MTKLKRSSNNRKSVSRRTLTVEIAQDIDIDEPLDLSDVASIDPSVRLLLARRLTSAVVAIHREINAIADERQQLDNRVASLLSEASMLSRNLITLNEESQSNQLTIDLI